MVEKKVMGPASYFPAIEKKYGKPIEHWMKELKKVSKLAHMEQVAHLKEKFEMGHGHANAIVAVFRQKNGLQGTHLLYSYDKAMVQLWNLTSTVQENIEMKTIRSALLIFLGVFFLISGEADDSPGLQGLGLILILTVIYFYFRRVKSK